MVDGQARRAPKAPDDVVFQVCREVVAGRSASDIAADVAARTRKTFSREQVYPYLIEGAYRGFFQLRPPFEKDIASRVLRTYRLDPLAMYGIDPIHVVNVNGPVEIIREQVNAKAAEVALALIEAIARQKGHGERVHLGLGSGRTTMDVARRLAQLMANEPIRVPPMAFHAISSGFSVTDPETACVTFFSYFQRVVSAKYYGLFAPTFVEPEEYENMITLPGVAEAMERKGEIDLVITSLASASDKHGELHKFIDHASGAVKQNGELKAAKQRGRAVKEFEAFLRGRGWVGDVQYRPYSNDDYISVDVGFRAVTLFELPDLVDLARRPGKAVLLVAGPCADCENTRSAALVPLLDNRKLKVWSHIVTDVRTAKECEENAPGRADQPKRRTRARAARGK